MPRGEKYKACAASSRNRSGAARKLAREMFGRTSGKVGRIFAFACASGLALNSASAFTIACAVALNLALASIAALPSAGDLTAASALASPTALAGAAALLYLSLRHLPSFSFVSDALRICVSSRAIASACFEESSQSALRIALILRRSFPGLMPGGAEDHVEFGTVGKVELRGLSAGNVKSFGFVILTDP
jgi:hypothetical protein